jgi:hypothetical protein
VDPIRVAKNYTKSIRFPVDILASIPFEAIIYFFGTDTSNDEEVKDTLQFQLLGILKLIRLLRLGRIITYMKVNAGLKIGFRIL